MITQVKKLATAEQFRAHIESIEVSLPMVDTVDPQGVLSTPVMIGEPGSASAMTVPNRFAVLPMEGWDCGTDGQPSELLERRWSRFAHSGAGLVWCEATAVCPEGRANPNQLMINDATIGALATLRDSFAADQVVGLQLTHSGRWARPVGEPAPRIAYRHPQLDDKVAASDASVFSDDELEDLAGNYIRAAHLAAQAGFDFVDIKACHGYLLHELLTAYERPGRHGGDLRGRTRLLRTVIETVRRELPALGVAVRLSIFDYAPHEPGADGTGVPETGVPYRLAFGGDGTGSGIDLTETHELLELLSGLGVRLVCASAGSPYYVPHIQRPAYFPPSDGYKPPEDPLVGVARLLAATAEITTRHPGLTVVGAGYSYLQEWLANVAEAVIEGGGAHMIGIGRMALSYPDLPADVLAGNELQHRMICRTFSDCTTAPRNGLVSGCYPLDDFYKERPERVTLTRAKRESRQDLRG